MSDASLRSPAVKITAREREVLQLLARGSRLDDCAETLGIGHETVRSHVRNAVVRLGASNRTQAVAIAIRHGLIEA